jgi:hypothetical protein
MAVGEPSWLAAPVLLGLLGWASGKFNPSFQRGNALVRELAPELQRSEPAQR